jgi:phosphoglycerate kinase
MIRFTEWKLASKRVFLRADLNVPLHNGKIGDDFRFLALQPTLDYLISKGASVILATHIGRPQGYNKELTTQPIGDWLQSRGYKTTFIPYEPTGFVLPTEHKPAHIYLLDNLRFFDGEKKCDELFARLLHSYADYYVTDAFGIAHETAASTTVLPNLFKKEHRSWGFLIKTELVHLSFLLREEKKLTLVVGGGKGSDKIPYLKKLIERPHVSLLIGTAVAFTFFKAQGIFVANSLVNDDMLDIARFIIKHAQKNSLYLPVDIISRTPTNELITHDIQNFPDNGVGVTIGPKTLTLFKSQIQKTDMLFYNCAMGFTEDPQTLLPAEDLIKCVSQAKAYRTAGGGDTVALVRSMGMQPSIDFCSTGGGASLAFLAQAPMPGVESI